MEQLFRTIYFDPSHAGGLGGADKLYRAAKDRDPKVTKKDVKKWLSSVDAYTLYKPIKRNFETSRVISAGLHVQADVDLADVSNLAKQNDGVKFLLVAVDILSRKLYVQPLKSKKPSDVAKAFQILWNKDERPRLLRSDRGMEFRGKEVKAFYKKAGIHHFMTNSERKANYSERAIRSLRERIWRFITHRQNERYVDDLPKIVYAHNNAINSGIGIAPSSVTKENERAVWWSAYWPKKRRKRRPFLFDVGDHVRISYLRPIFAKVHDYTFSGEVFKISARSRRDLIPVYSLKDLQDEKIQGTFYTEELVKVAPHDIWKIEKVLRTRKRRGQPRESLVRWLHFPKKFDEWIPTESIVEQ